MQFTKLFSSILDSTIWQEPAETRLIWITMLAMVDRRGEVHASIPGLAKRAGVTLSECENALECLLSPDKYSRTPDHEGRRITPIDGGWELLNHAKYRALLSAEERREYNRKKQAEYRAKKKDESKGVNDMSITVNHSEQNAHITESEADTEAERTKKESVILIGKQAEEIRQAYPTKKAKPEALKAITKALKKAPFEELLAKTKTFAKSREGEDHQFTPLPSTWFNQERWTDEEAPTSQPKPNPQRAHIL